jgi:hypothetical protein
MNPVALSSTIPRLRAIADRSDDSYDDTCERESQSASELIMQYSEPGIIEERLGAIIVDGQRCDVWVRSEPDTDGTWHNALLFRRDGRAAGRDELMTGVSWHLPPGIALARAQELEEQEQVALFQRALTPRPPIV